ncbi:sodium:solute symporter [candidate division KSB1 bacterium]
MSPKSILFVFLAYTFLLFVVSWITSKKADNDSFFVGNKVSPWYIVAYGMIGASLSGVTFISIPGDVGSTQFSYMMIVFGYLLGYFTIANILLPLYYKLNLTSIYTYLENRFGFWSYKTGAFFFLLSRIIGASFRMFLVVNVLQIFVFDAWNIPFAVTVAICIILIILYTFKGGIKTIVWTDTLQTTFMLAAVIISVFLIKEDLNVSFRNMISDVFDREETKMLFWEWKDKRFFLKQFFSGMFITIVMTGLDQDMMQKNLSCRNLKDAKKNMYWMSSMLVPVNFLFLALGAILFYYIQTKGINAPALTDDLFPTIALKHLSPFAGIVFIIGLISAAYSSADSALTSLTTSFCIDILNINKNTILDEKQKKRIRNIVHFLFAGLLLIVVLVFKAINNHSVISMLFTAAGYTYGPLLGLYSFGLFTKRKIQDKWAPIVAVLSALCCYFINTNSEVLFDGFEFGFFILIVNGMLTFLGLFVISNTNSKS